MASALPARDAGSRESVPAFSQGGPDRQKNGRLGEAA
ncbi:hypothetical protein FB599_2710 [Herbaspirillum sp. SJZ130]|nr:hypothetical protein [Herbaspirillum sp. SJZ102]TQK04159.1 hypothetical protein FB599_2710 [Herbaspirillum sp. SJZ130]TQK10056.1 hypothetical protein FB598_3052 [Herbaspirillum sp. SJZ106]TWC63628.1 hypothetical protein FB597_11061 [Herbaspirillum sp. SJZ099]